MQIRTTAGSGAAGLGIIGTGLTVALPEEKWIGWLVVGVGIAVFMFDVRIDGWNIKFAKSPSLKVRAVAALCCLTGILWFDYWYYSSVLNRPQFSQTAPAPAPAPPPPPAKPKLLSNLTKMVLVCDSPKATGKTPSLKERKAELAKFLDLMQKMFGFPTTGSVAEDEFSFSVEVPQPTGGNLKQDYLMKRSGDKIFVSITNHMPANALAFIFALASFAPIDPDEDVAKQTQAKVEEMVKVEPGKCKFI